MSFCKKPSKWLRIRSKYTLTLYFCFDKSWAHSYYNAQFQNITNLLWNPNRPICLSWFRNLCRHLPEYYNPPDHWLSRNFYDCGLFLYLKIILRSMMKCCFWEHSNQSFYLSRFFLFLFFLYHDCFSWRFAWIFHYFARITTSNSPHSYAILQNTTGLLRLWGCFWKWCCLRARIQKIYYPYFKKLFL